MTAPSSKFLAMPLSFLGAALLVASCGDKTPPPRSGPLVPSALPRMIESCDELKVNKWTEIPILAPAEAQARIRSLLSESYRLIQASVALEAEMMEACRVIGRGAGAFDEELKGVPSAGKGAEKVCSIAFAKAEKILEEAKASKTPVLVEFDKPLCFTDVGTIKQCLVDCGQQVTGDDKASCTGGELYGTCKGRCSAACANDPGTGVGACWGVCSGKCDKDFRGTCGGKCTGTCNGRKVPGAHRCIGICDGACNDKSEGICGGKCDGACNGPWEPRDPAKCNGICTGQCSGQAGQPVCSGDYVPPGVEATCLATCTSIAAVGVRCDTPLVRIEVKGGKQNAELQKLLAGLQAGLPRLMRISDGVSKKMPRAMEGISAAAIEWSNAYATSGPKPLSCVRASLDGMKAAADATEIAVRGSEGWKPLILPLIKPAAPPPGPPPDP
jgi:hypothetical protein